MARNVILGLLFISLSATTFAKPNPQQYLYQQSSSDALAAANANSETIFASGAPVNSYPVQYPSPQPYPAPYPQYPQYVPPAPQPMPYYPSSGGYPSSGYPSSGYPSSGGSSSSFAEGSASAMASSNQYPGQVLYGGQ